MFSQKKVLIVDDFAEFRLSLRSMVDGFGCATVDLAKNGEEAVALYQQNRHHIVLCDYNLGKQQNGQQVLEEISLRGWLRADTVFVLITAETSLSMVMGALEFRPDDYLSKPINKANLRTRLTRLLQQKSELSDIYQALGQHDYALARKRCAGHIKAKSRYAGACYRLLAEILLRQEKPAEAKAIYQQMVDVRASRWALQGLAESHFMLAEIDACIDVSKQVLADNSRAVDAMELLAKCYMAQGQYPEAYDFIKQAIAISPRSIKRQRIAAQIAKLSSDQQAELRALRHIHELGIHSVQAEPDDNVKYLNMLIGHAEAESGVNRRRLIAEAQDQLARFSRHKIDERHHCQGLILQAQMARVQGSHKQAEELLTQVYEQAPALMQQQDELTLAMLQEGLQQTGMDEHKEHVEQQLRQSREQHQQREQIAAKSTENVRGIKQYEAGDYVAAIASFRDAIASNPASTAITLNLVQALLKHLPPGTDRMKVRDECTTLLDQQRFLQPNNPRYKRYQMLKSKIHQL
ncbi:response regulator [Neiella sp. HB171785]|uniref:Response regulator n=1 Tax=Neiella litorisoli TaxID=2771431 RepID=A0A8J6UE58_9GAMM|nr:tetratricopeptide repeat-containing response regulator [Neiella litorisoli]MBD1389234.1 response regulator [Neiella litorisoli]